MANFEIAFRRRMPIEGGHSLDLTDDGNWNGGKQVKEWEVMGKMETMTQKMAIDLGLLVGTNFGITAPEYAKFLGKKTVTFAEMKNMPIEHAMTIFKKNYWQPIRGDEIDSQGIANDIYDNTVNIGLITGIKQMQQAMGIPVNGKVDDYMINQLNNK